MPSLSPAPSVLRCATAALLLVLATTGRAADDDFFAPSPFVQATAAFASGNIAQAETLVAPLAQGDAATAEACALLGQIRLAQKRPAEAVTEFERAVAAKPASPVLHSQLGGALLVLAEAATGEERATRLQRARLELEQAAAANADLADAQLGLVRLHLLAPQSDSAAAIERHAAAAIRLDPWEGAGAIAQFAEQHNRPDVAEKYYGVMADKVPANPWLRLRQAAMLARLGRTAEARARLETILQAFAGFPPAVELLNSLPAQ